MNSTATPADHLLGRISSTLAARFTGVFSAETVDRYVHEFYVALHRTAKIKTYVPTLAEHFATERLTALAQSQGAIAKPVLEVLFVCVHNAGRSQMAAALLDRVAAGRVHVRSAGSAPAEEINAAVVQAMSEIGLDLSIEFPKPLTDDLVRAADVVITMGCGDACPVYPGSATWTGICQTLPIKTSTPSARSATEIDAQVHKLLDDVLATA